ncbi:Transcriptional activator FeaR [Pseudovibrio sp. WM33]|nr:Transcriptional activator FeaR [Pseudovibrio sp. WM33]
MSEVDLIDGAPRAEISQPIPQAVFSVDGVAPDERFSLWKESISFMFQVEADHAVRSDEFTAEVDAHMFGQIILARTKSRKQFWERSELTIAKDGMDHFMIQLFETGDMIFEHDGAQHSVAQDGLIIFDLARTSKSWTNTFSNLSLIIPRELLEPKLVYPDGQHMRRLPAAQPMVQLLYSHIKTLKELSGQLSLSQAADINPATISLVTACLNSTSEGVALDEANSHAAQIMLAKRTISEHLSNPDLSPETVAIKAGISRSKLYEMFRNYGGVKSFILEQRLKGAMMALISNSNAHRSNSEIAFSFGFTYESTFSRAFKKRFSMTPSEARNSAGIAWTRAMSTPNVDRRYEDWVKYL